MSKIEKALAKAGGRVIRFGSAAGAAAGKQLVATGERGSPNRELDLASATRMLARMHERAPLDVVAIAERNIISVETADADVIVAFRELRTKIVQAARGNCTIMVAPVSKNADGGFVAANLAVSFALDDTKSALLIDCGLGTPLFDHLSAPEALGITDYLKGEGLSVEQIIQSVGIRRLRLISAGRRHDKLAEYFTLAKMRGLIGELRERYPDRYLVLGTPSIGESADARILLDLADYAVLVVPYGRLTEAEIAEATKGIDKGKLLGVVFSGVPTVPRDKRRPSGWLRGLFGMRPKRHRERPKKAGTA